MHTARGFSRSCREAGPSHVPPGRRPVIRALLPVLPRLVAQGRRLCAGGERGAGGLGAGSGQALPLGLTIRRQRPAEGQRVEVPARRQLGHGGRRAARDRIDEREVSRRVHASCGPDVPSQYSIRCGLRRSAARPVNPDAESLRAIWRNA